MFLERSPKENEASILYDYVFSVRDDLGFYNWASEAFGGPILEVGSGTGRVLIPTAEAGFDITGIDPNASRVNQCIAEIAKKGISDKARAIVGSILDFRSEQKFSLVTMPFRGFQHILTPHEQEVALRNIFSLLKPGGHCIIDIFNPNIEFLGSPQAFEESSSNQQISLPNGETVELRGRVIERSHTEQIQHCEEIYVVRSENGAETRTVRAFTTRYTFRYEIEHLSRLVGFEVLETFGDFKRTPFGEGASNEILMVLRKPE